MISLLLTATSLAAPDPAPLPHDTIEDAVRADVRGTAASIEAVATTVSALSPSRRADAAESLRILVEIDPYTRVAMELPFVLQHGVSTLDANRLDPLVRRDWDTLQRGLDTHVEVLESLGVADPDLTLRSLVREIEQLPTATERIDGPTRKRIELTSARVEKSTGILRPCPRGPWHPFPGQPWTLGLELGGWHDALRRVEPFVDGPDAQGRIRAMIDALDAYGEQSRE